MSIAVGCQGWRYPDWYSEASEPGPLAAPFYGRGLSASEQLGFYSRTFDLVEVDSTFYGTPKPQAVQGWLAAVPDAFRFTFKLPRQLTHEYRLQRGRATLAQFCDVARLASHQLAAILIQLPPSFGPEQFPVLERFLPHLPADLPFAVEFRHAGWLVPRTLELLKAHRVALTLGETPWIPTATALPLFETPTSNWVYLRFMGAKDNGLAHFTHRQLDRSAVLDAWVGPMLRQSGRGLQILALLDNHFEGFSPGTAQLLRRKLGLPERPFPRDLPPPVEQLGLRF